MCWVLKGANDDDDGNNDDDDDDEDDEDDDDGGGGNCGDDGNDGGDDDVDDAYNYFFGMVNHGLWHDHSTGLATSEALVTSSCERLWWKSDQSFSFTSRHLNLF